MESWNIWKTSDWSCQRHNVWAALFFSVFFLPLPFLSYLQPPVWIALHLEQQRGICTNLNQGYYWWLHHFPISQSLAAVSSYIIFYSLSWYDGYFPPSLILCSSEDNVTRKFLTTIWLEDKNRTTCTGFLYLNRCNCMAWYLIDLFRTGYRRHLYLFMYPDGVWCIVQCSRMLKWVYLE